jgi:ABC-2 type transport system ATP-binding protein
VTPAGVAADGVAVAVEGLCMQYGAKKVLQDVSFQAARGEVLALLGPNGAGKTTTVEILEGFRRRSAGRVAVLGADPDATDERWQARLGVVLQSWRDHAKWRTRQFLSYQARYYAPYSTSQTPRPWDADELLAAVGLTAHADTQLRMLSGGQRRRLDLAVGLVGRPELLFLDEPTAGLDPQARREFHDLVALMAGELDTTVLLTTHDLDEADKLAGRIIILADGRIVADGTSAELAHEIAGPDEVRWVYEGRRFTESTPDSTGFARLLFDRYGDAVTELEVRRASLEDTYLALVRNAESALSSGPADLPAGQRAA